MAGSILRCAFCCAFFGGLVSSFAFPAPCVAEVIVSSTLLDGDQAIPSIGSDAVGASILALDTDANEFSFDLFVTGIELGGRLLIQEHPELIPRPPLISALRNRRILAAVTVWTLVNLLFGLFFSEFFNSGGIAWEAHLGGFFTGFLLFSWFDQGLQQ